MWLVQLCVTALALACVSAQSEVDVAFILDGSGSVGDDNYHGAFKDFIEGVARSLPLSSDLYQIAVVTFGNEGEVQLDFNAAGDSNDLERLLDDREVYYFLNQNTNTSGGLQVARQMFENEEMGARSDVAQVAYLLTDGPSTRGRDQTIPEADAMRANGIDIHVIGIERPTGQSLDREEITLIVGNDESRVTIIEDDFTSFEDDMNEHVERAVRMIQDSMDGDGTTTTTTTARPTEEPTTPRVTGGPTRPTRDPQTTPTPGTTTTTEPLPQTDEWQCSFEQDGRPSTCGIQRDGGFRWLQRVGRTPSAGTGPSEAFDGEVYLYMEASRPSDLQDEAMAFVPKRVFDGRQCLSFAAHMSGEDMGALEVLRVRGDGSEDILWSVNGQQEGGNWFSRSLETDIRSDDKGLAFRGLVGDGYRGDIGLDAIRVTSGSC